MTNVWQDLLAARREAGGRWLFFRRALAHPLQLFSPLPSSASLGRLVARHIPDLAQARVVEIGGGTGAITRALLEAGLLPDRLIVIEIDDLLADYLRREFPDVRVISGDAARLPELLPPSWRGAVGTVINGIPMAVLSAPAQQQLFDTLIGALGANGRYLQYTYSLFSPLQVRRLGLKGRRLGITFGNFPPASLWTYRRNESAAAQ
jgi:phosphatidylethanolamine/phosphatidyl-N-methylethanolamine N-methyltransferase